MNNTFLVQDIPDGAEITFLVSKESPSFAGYFTCKLYKDSPIRRLLETQEAFEFKRSLN